MNQRKSTKENNFTTNSLYTNKLVVNDTLNAPTNFTTRELRTKDLKLFLNASIIRKDDEAPDRTRNIVLNVANLTITNSIQNQIVQYLVESQPPENLPVNLFKKVPYVLIQGGQNNNVSYFQEVYVSGFKSYEYGADKAYTFVVDFEISKIFCFMVIRSQSPSIGDFFLNVRYKSGLALIPGTASVHPISSAQPNGFTMTYDFDEALPAGTEFVISMQQTLASGTQVNKFYIYTERSIL